MRDQEQFLHGQNITYLAELYSKYLENPARIDESWHKFFNELDGDTQKSLMDVLGPSWSKNPSQIIGVRIDEASQQKGEVSAVNQEQVQKLIQNSIRALMLIRAYRVRGHLHANLDPLGIQVRKDHPELDPSAYGFTEEDYDQPIQLEDVLGLEQATLRKILEVLNDTYCGNIGVEFMHIQDPDEKSWIQERIEKTHSRPNFSKEEKIAIFEKLVIATEFEKFLDKKYPGTKRFGLDGAESTIPALEQVMKSASDLKIEEVVLGMAHRGRLNVLANVMEKPYKAIFSEFQGVPSKPEDVQGSGDVKYHLGTSTNRDFSGKNLHLSLTANPSHLEAVNPVVLGKVRAKQSQLNDEKHEKVMGLLIHGDAAFAGQGVVSECLAMSQLKGYRTGGTVHFIINNQIGFTTAPAYSRSGVYSSDVAKSAQAPVFHVNGDDPEAVAYVAKLATDFKQKFGKDVVIDMYCYRRFGHNEGDEPAFTQPNMYKRISAHIPVVKLYQDRLIKEGVFNEEEADQIIEAFKAKLDEDFKLSNAYKPDQADWLAGKWEGISASKKKGANRGKTAVTKKEIDAVGNALTTVPENFVLNKKLDRQLKQKEKILKEGKNIDWATAEALAFGTLLQENVGVRLSGQDCGRGTFSQRHSVWIDQETENKYVPLNHISENQENYEVIDSLLSEMGVLGYEYGYSLAEPRTLVLWEAQFGDFANGAQVIYDQFISAGEIKWLRMSGLVMLLPHGYEGQGPEHSSARLERYLQLCAEDNTQVANCTTPANYFHILRRQVCRDFRKPLVLMTPKSLLRHKGCVSSLDEFTGKSTFHRVLYDYDFEGNEKKAKRIVFCSGKVYYDLFEKRQEAKLKDTHIIRVEQLYPFPEDVVTDILKKCKDADIVWCQEEPENMGAWHFILPRLTKLMHAAGVKQNLPIYAGRNAAASPATGDAKKHALQQETLVKDALNIK